MRNQPLRVAHQPPVFDTAAAQPLLHALDEDPVW